MRRIAFFIAVTAVVVLGIAPAAWAHISVSPSEAAAGSFTTLVFQVPNEEAEANTTKLQVQFPQENPIAEASVQPVAGWTINVAKKPLSPPVTTDEGDTLSESVDTITWTAASGGGIKPGQFQQFLVAVGLPSDPGVLVFPAVQTYSDGTTVQWIETTADAEHPAPSVTLTAGGESGGSTTTTTVKSGGGDGGSAAKDLATKSDVNNAKDSADSAKTAAIVGIVVGTIGVILAAIALVMAARKRGSTTT